MVDNDVDNLVLNVLAAATATGSLWSKGRYKDSIEREMLSCLRWACISALLCVGCSVHTVGLERKHFNVFETHTHTHISIYICFLFIFCGVHDLFAHTKSFRGTLVVVMHVFMWVMNFVRNVFRQMTAFETPNECNYTCPWRGSHLYATLPSNRRLPKSCKHTHTGARSVPYMGKRHDDCCWCRRRRNDDD